MTLGEWREQATGLHDSIDNHAIIEQWAHECVEHVGEFTPTVAYEERIPYQQVFLDHVVTEWDGVDWIRPAIACAIWCQNAIAPVSEIESSQRRQEEMIWQLSRLAELSGRDL